MAHRFDERRCGHRRGNRAAAGGGAAVLTLVLVALVAAGSARAATFPIATGSAQGQLCTGQVAFDGTNYLVGIRGDAGSPHTVNAQRVSQSGSLVGPLISTGHTGGPPGAGFDGTNFALIWLDDATAPANQVYGQRISPSGSVVGSAFRIGPSSGGQELSGGAVGDTNYLIVWRCDEDAGVCTGLRGQLVSFAGERLGPVVTISDAGGDTAVAFDGTNYLVVWRGSGAAAYAVFGRFVSQTGQLVGSAFVINDSAALSFNPVAVEFDGTNYLVVWPDLMGTEDSHEWDLFGQLVTPSGNLSGAVIPITTAPGAQNLPFIAFDGAHYLVTWTDSRNDANRDNVCDVGEGTCADVWGQYLSMSGASFGSAFPIAAEAGNQVFSPVTFAAGRYMMVWNSGVTITSDGELIGGDVYGTFLEPPSAGCVGDCDGSGSVDVTKIIKMVNIALGTAPVTDCEGGDADGSGGIDVTEIIQAVNSVLNGC